MTFSILQSILLWTSVGKKECSDLSWLLVVVLHIKTLIFSLPCLIKPNGILLGEEKFVENKY